MHAEVRRRTWRVSPVAAEQNAKLTFTLADRCVVLQNGEVVKEGASTDLRDDPEVRRM